MKEGLPKIYLLLLLPFCYSISIAQTTFSNEFLTIGVGGKAHGMSGAMVANVDDITSGFWNPAGLTNVNNDSLPIQVGVMHAEWFAGIAQYDYVSIARPLNKERRSAIGISYIRLGIDQIPNTLRLREPDGTINFDNVTEFSAADNAFILSYAQQLKVPKLTLGVNAKIIRRVIGQFAQAWGFGIDVGLQYYKGDWKFGLMARDVSSTFNAWKFNFTEEEKIILDRTDNDIPVNTVEITRPRFILGAAYNKRFTQKLSLLAEINLDFTTDGQRNVLISSKAINIDPHFGFQLGYHISRSANLYLRGGFGNIQRALNDVSGNSKITTVQPNFGLGINVGKARRFRIDYALTDIGNISQTLYSHVFSLIVEMKKKERRPKLEPQ